MEKQASIGAARPRWINGMTARSYYNEIDSYAAQWLRNLIDAGLIAPGDVDERDIREVTPDDVKGYTQCHFFAGIGGWSHALRLAGWPDDRPVWTGSPPCQPFSTAGRGLGVKDERHLAPVFLDLVRECRPPVIFGEQVAAAVTKDGWLDLLFDALEDAGYACGAAVIPACSVGAPHIRQRLWSVAERVGDGDYAGSQRWPGVPERSDQLAAGQGGVAGRMANSDCFFCPRDGHEVRGLCEDGLERPGEPIPDSPWICCADCRPGPTNGFWRAADWLFCRDGKWRPVEPGTFPLATRIPARVGRLRAYGNAIVPQDAAEVIRAFMKEVRDE